MDVFGQFFVVVFVSTLPIFKLAALPHSCLIQLQFMLIFFEEFYFHLITFYCISSACFGTFLTENAVSWNVALFSSGGWRFSLLHGATWMMVSLTQIMWGSLHVVRQRGALQENCYLENMTKTGGELYPWHVLPHKHVKCKSICYCLQTQYLKRIMKCYFFSQWL